MATRIKKTAITKELEELYKATDKATDKYTKKVNAAVYTKFQASLSKLIANKKEILKKLDTLPETAGISKRIFDFAPMIAGMTKLQNLTGGAGALMARLPKESEKLIDSWNTLNAETKNYFETIVAIAKKGETVDARTGKALDDQRDKILRNMDAASQYGEEFKAAIPDKLGRGINLSEALGFKDAKQKLDELKASHETTTGASMPGGTQVRAGLQIFGKSIEDNASKLGLFNSKLGGMASQFGGFTSSLGKLSAGLAVIKGIASILSVVVTALLAINRRAVEVRTNIYDATKATGLFGLGFEYAQEKIKQLDVTSVLTSMTDLGINMKEAAAIANTLENAGIRVNDVMKPGRLGVHALRTVVSLSKVTGLEIGKVADIMGGFILDLHEGTDEAGESFAVLAQMAGRSELGMSKYMSIVGAVTDQMTVLNKNVKESGILISALGGASLLSSKQLQDFLSDAQGQASRMSMEQALTFTMATGTGDLVIKNMANRIKTMRKQLEEQIKAVEVDKRKIFEKENINLDAPFAGMTEENYEQMPQHLAAKLDELKVLEGGMANEDPSMQAAFAIKHGDLAGTLEALIGARNFGPLSGLSEDKFLTDPRVEKIHEMIQATGGFSKETADAVAKLAASSINIRGQSPELIEAYTKEIGKKKAAGKNVTEGLIVQGVEELSTLFTVIRDLDLDQAKIFTSMLSSAHDLAEEQMSLEDIVKLKFENLIDTYVEKMDALQSVVETIASHPLFGWKPPDKPFTIPEKNILEQRQIRTQNLALMKNIDLVGPRTPRQDRELDVSKKKLAENRGAQLKYAILIAEEGLRFKKREIAQREKEMGPMDEDEKTQQLDAANKALETFKYKLEKAGEALDPAAKMPSMPPSHAPFGAGSKVGRAKSYQGLQSSTTAPYDNFLARLHEGEKILPKNLPRTETMNIKQAVAEGIVAGMRYIPTRTAPSHNSFETNVNMTMGAFDANAFSRIVNDAIYTSMAKMRKITE